VKSLLAFAVIKHNGEESTFAVAKHNGAQSTFAVTEHNGEESTFAVAKHNGAQSTFGPPVFSLKTNTSAPTSPVFIRSCTTCFLFPELTGSIKRTHFQSTEDIHKKMAVYLKHSHKMTSEDTSRPERLIWSSVYLLIKTILKGITWRYILLLLPLALQPAVGFGLSNNTFFARLS
jgi:hypothetical protein